MKQKRTERLQIMLSSNEIAALDEWRFEQRMPSRAAAVRQLLRLGLGLSDDIDFKVNPAELASGDIGIVESPLDDELSVAPKS